ncbi:MAG: RHS repeat-associated core domain-containing protein [Silvanigrellaceae bacterium]|nr:RHS repeat-associated core domain-containing protein [Silvanigrellaceae bacterium]
MYIDGIFEHSYHLDGSNTMGEELNELHILDDQTRVAMLRTGYDDGTPFTKYILSDHLGSSNVILEDDGSVYNREEYYPFGETSFGSFGKKRYRYCGKEKDEESGLYYYGARYFQPWSCRFISVDPLAHKYPFYTPYQYAGNKPIISIDIDGLEGNNDTGQQTTSQVTGTNSNIPLPTKPSDEHDVIRIDPTLYKKAENLRPTQTREEIQQEYDKSQKSEQDTKTYNNKINQLDEYEKTVKAIQRLEKMKEDLMNANSSSPLGVLRDEILKNGKTVFLSVGTNLTDPSTGERKGAITQPLNPLDPTEAFVITFDFEYLDAHTNSDALNNMRENNSSGMDLSSFRNTDTTLLTHELGHVYFNTMHPERYSDDLGVRKEYGDKSEDYAQKVERLQLLSEFKGNIINRNRILNTN